MYTRIHLPRPYYETSLRDKNLTLVVQGLWPVLSTSRCTGFHNSSVSASAFAVKRERAPRKPFLLRDSALLGPWRVGEALPSRRLHAPSHRTASPGCLC